VPTKTFLIFDENFELGRRDGRKCSQTWLKNFKPGSMTRATLHMDITLDEDKTGWGPFGADEFVAGIWVHNTSGDPVVSVELGNREYHKYDSAPVGLKQGDNYFYFEINHGERNELGHASGHVKAWVEVEYSDPNNPPGGSEPVTLLNKVVRWVGDHPLETALIGLGGLFVYEQAQPKKKKKPKSVGGEEEVQNIIIFPGGVTAEQVAQVSKMIGTATVTGAKKVAEAVIPKVKESVSTTKEVVRPKVKESVSITKEVVWPKVKEKLAKGVVWPKVKEKLTKGGVKE